MIPEIRAIPPRRRGSRRRSVASAAIGHDFLVAQAERMPFAVGLTLLASGSILFLLFGSRGRSRSRP